MVNIVVNKDVKELMDLSKRCNLTKEEEKNLAAILMKVKSTPEKLAATIALNSFSSDKMNYYIELAKVRNKKEEKDRLLKLVNVGKEIVDEKTDEIKPKYKSLIEKIRAQKDYFGRIYSDPRDYGGSG